MVLPASHRIPRVPWYSGSCRLTSAFVYGTFTLFGLPSQVVLLASVMPSAVLNPYYISIIGLASSPFARHYLGNRFFFLFLRLLRCFSSAGSPRIPMCSVYGDWILLQPGSPIRTSAGQWLFAPHRSFSQLITSFFGS